MTLFKTVAQMPCLRRYFLFRYKYKIECSSGVTYKKLFEIIDRRKLDYFKKLRYTRRPHPAKIHTRFKPSGLKRFKTLNSAIIYPVFKDLRSENHGQEHLMGSCHGSI